MKVEGILLRKISYGERHIIGKILLRNGKSVSGMFYGGQGGGAKKKSSILEIGHCLSLEIQRPKNDGPGAVRESSLIWAHKKIRDDFKAFYVMSYFCEIASRLCVEVAWDQFSMEEKTDEGLFRVLSNALVHLESALVEGTFVSYHEFVIFMIKLFEATGVLPTFRECALSGEKIEKGSEMNFSAAAGGFVLRSSVDTEGFPLNSDQAQQLWSFFVQVLGQKYLEVELKSSLYVVDFFDVLLDFLCQQFHIKKHSIKSIQLLQ